MKLRTLIKSLMILCILTAGCTGSGTRYGKHSKDQEEKKMKISKENFGVTNGQEVFLFTLQNTSITVKIINYGGIVTSILTPDSEGKIEDIVLGFDKLDPYVSGHPYFGAIVGRYGNRIAKGRFTLDGQTYQLSINNGENHLHGGSTGFDKVVWEATEFITDESVGVELKYHSADGEEGYPGNMEVRIIYSLNNANELKIEYFATTSKATPVNLTHHSYFNLKGAGNGDVLDHLLKIDAGKYTEVDETLIPTGELKDVSNTPFDFRKRKPIGSDISETEGGYDHNFVLNNQGNLSKVVEVLEPASGRKMEVYTSEPGLQFYSGNFLDGSITGKNQKKYHKHYGFCLETQHYPDSPNHPEFPSTILRPEEIYHYATIYKFLAR